jgi:hypothetical protein
MAEPKLRPPPPVLPVNLRFRCGASGISLRSVQCIWQAHQL